MEKVLALTPSFIAFAWVLWYCVQARWSEVIAPNWRWVLVATGLATCTVYWITGMRIRKNPSKDVAIVKPARLEPEEREEALVVKETLTWRTVTRERSVYAEPK